VDNSKLFVNLGGWFQNSKVHYRHPLDIGEGFYTPSFNDIHTNDINQTNLTTYSSELVIHQSMLASLLNSLSSTHKTFIFTNQSEVIA